MLIYSIVTMRDLMRNYKMLLKRKSESDSDCESQPLMSSSSSSSHSFGSIIQPQVYKHDSDLESDESVHLVKSTSRSSVSPISIHKHINRHAMYVPSFEPPELDIYTNTGIVYESCKDFTKINGILPVNDTTLQGQKNVNGSFSDYKDIEVPNTNNSLVTIFAIWNTTMGSSLLAMSWGLEKTGLFSGIFLNILLAAICLYTAYILLNINEKHGMIGQNIEVCDLCKMLIGRWAEIVAKVFSLIILIGANIVYWILMSNFLYNSIHFFYGLLLLPAEEAEQNMSVMCPKELVLNLNATQLVVTNSPSTFEKIWDLYSTVPVFLGLLMFPMLNFKSATFFTKFNSLGTFSVLYLLIFVAIKSFQWGVNIPDWSVEFYFKPTFSVLTGMLSMSYFIHNIIISIMRNNKHQERNGRDLSIAFGLVTFTYLFIGVCFYISFPLAKSCIEDNILNNFSKYDVMTIIARILLMFQLFTVFPLMSYMLRNDIFTNINMIFKNYRFGDFTYGRVVILNLVVIFICVMFACFLPRIGTLIRYTGALSGMVYIFMLPSLLKIASLKKDKALTTTKFVFHVLIIFLGAINLIAQFFISDK